MRVREAVPEDADAVRRVHVESITGLGLGGYTWEQVDAWAAGCDSADYAAAIAAPDQCYVVAVLFGDVVGFGSLRDPGDESTTDGSAAGEVTAIYVHPAAARSGVGTALYEDLERRARASGVERLELMASQRFEAEAHDFSRGRKPTWASRGILRVLCRGSGVFMYHVSICVGTLRMGQNGLFGGASVGRP